MIKIGYQGMAGSNSERAAKKIAEKLNLTDVELIPLISSKSVIGMLKRNEITYGVVAVKNSIGGIVEETYNAIKTEFIDLVATELLDIHHCLFTKSSDIPLTQINQIASHPQALKQCKNNIQEKFGDIKLKEVEDTAISAKYLEKGKLGLETAILCSKEAGENHHLHLVAENFEDNRDNVTEFRMFKNSEDPEKEDISLIDQMLHYSFTDKGLGTLSKALMMGAIFITLYFQKDFGMSNFETASTIGGLLSGVFLFLTSSKLKNKVRYRSIIGHWKYNSIPQNKSINDLDQKYEVPRIVKIEEIDGELLFSGWMCDNENAQLFSSQRVLISELGKRNGKLIYWYNTPSVMSREYDLNGIVTLGWNINNPASKINKMSGWYLGKSTNEIGSLHYTRISKEDFNIMKKSDYL
ncbi:prephenate dehydratase [Sunxiuqinia rutila]|uniref:prephenate dehydratase n=1 Tax=Sunxiuqinia rutila TaxID=1397841 RepID=UPI003D37002B